MEAGRNGTFYVNKRTQELTAKYRGTALPKDPVILFVVGCLFTVAGVVVMSVGIKWAFDAVEISKWPTTHGTIIESGIDYNTSEGRNDGNPPILFGSKVKYSYETGGIEYTSSRISFIHTISDNPSVEKKHAAKYVEGSRVRVYYNSEDPSLSLLEPGFESFICIPLILGLIFGIIGIFLVTKSRLLYRL